ncbi:TPA: hypothetical protein U1W09_002088 [Streptococcus suis]|nr:hypothetical protein [Streptococcus suis]HEM4067485.1 hypothetical protein [Streptococcus suis]
MKQNNTFIVLRDKEGNYLASYKNNKHVLAYSAGWASDVESALKVPEEYYYGKDHEKYLAMAMLFNAEPVKDETDEAKTLIEKMLADFLEDN